MRPARLCRTTKLHTSWDIGVAVLEGPACRAAAIGILIA
jgi:hypothetical protein